MDISTPTEIIASITKMATLFSDITQEHLDVLEESVKTLCRSYISAQEVTNGVSVRTTALPDLHRIQESIAAVILSFLETLHILQSEMATHRISYRDCNCGRCEFLQAEVNTQTLMLTQVTSIHKYLQSLCEG